MNTLTILCQLWVAIASLTAATIASFRPKRLSSLASLFSKSGVPRIVQSAAHWLASILTLLGIGVPFFAFFSGCLVFVTSIPLIIRAIQLKVSRAWLLPIMMAIVSVMIALAQPLGLKVIALPKADELLFMPAFSQVIKTYDQGLWFEGIAAGADGTLYLSGNRGLDFSRNDYYHQAQGELIARTTDGNERILFNTPKGLTAGVPVIGNNNCIYLTSHGQQSCIWQIDSNGKARQLVLFPPGAWPNGLDIGPDGMLYSPDSYLGIIWRIDPNSAKLTEALRDPDLLPRPFIALAPGANGLHFKGHVMMVSVSDRTTLLQYTMDKTGRFSPVIVVASGIPGDDFAIGKDGAIFITTHPYNTLVRVSSSGERTLIGNTTQHIIGATDAVFGKTVEDENTLYVVTDGGAFNGGTTTRGVLLAVRPYVK